MGMPECAFVDEVSEALLCSVCCCVLDDPVRTPCGHTFCRICITQWLHRGDQPGLRATAAPVSHTCPSCRAAVSVESLAKPDLIVREILDNLTIRCQQCKSWEGPWSCLQSHEGRCPGPVARPRRKPAAVEGPVAGAGAGAGGTSARQDAADLSLGDSEAKALDGSAAAPSDKGHPRCCSCGAAVPSWGGGASGEGASGGGASGGAPVTGSGAGAGAGAGSGACGSAADPSEVPRRRLCPACRPPSRGRLGGGKYGGAGGSAACAPGCDPGLWPALQTILDAALWRAADLGAQAQTAGAAALGASVELAGGAAERLGGGVEVLKAGAAQAAVAATEVGVTAVTAAAELASTGASKVRVLETATTVAEAVMTPLAATVEAFWLAMVGRDPDDIASEP